MLATIVSQLPIKLPPIDYQAIAPELLLFGSALAVLLVSALSGRGTHREVYRWIGIIGALASGGWSGYLVEQVAQHGPKLVIAGSVSLDGFSAVVGIIVSTTVVLALLIGPDFIARVAGSGPEYVALTLLSATGAVVMAQGEDLLVLFLGLEILSIALYVLVAYRIGDDLSREAAFKYFLLGGFSSAIFLYGVALVYGATGTTNLAKIVSFLAANLLISNGVLLFGIALILVGFAFKVSAVPFHLWSPDVYQGAPTSVTGYMAALAKIGGFAALLRVLMVAFPLQVHDWRPLVGALAVLSLVFGALFALRQREIKRILAYSSINHAGFILLGVYAATSAGVADALYYLAAYSVMVVGTFGLVSVIQLYRGTTEGALTLDGLRGFARDHPVIGIAFAVLILAQAGAPFTTGFFAKFSVLTAVIGVHAYWLAVVAMFAAAIAVAFYLRIVVVLYGADVERTVPRELAIQGSSDEGEGSVSLRGEPVVSSVAWVGIALSIVITIVFGVFPAPLVALCAHGKLLLG
ncbi:MAG: NADH-quinone oxidoreductase subunit N [Ferrimicrobium sp.]